MIERNSMNINPVIIKNRTTPAKKTACMLFSIKVYIFNNSYFISHKVRGAEAPLPIYASKPMALSEVIVRLLAV